MANHSREPKGRVATDENVAGKKKNEAMETATSQGGRRNREQTAFDPFAYYDSFFRIPEARPDDGFWDTFEKRRKAYQD